MTNCYPWDHDHCHPPTISQGSSECLKFDCDKKREHFLLLRFICRIFREYFDFCSTLGSRFYKQLLRVINRLCYFLQLKPFISLFRTTPPTSSTSVKLTTWLIAFFRPSAPISSARPQPTTRRTGAAPIRPAKVHVSFLLVRLTNVNKARKWTMLFLTALTFRQPFSNDTSNIIDKGQTDNKDRHVFLNGSTNIVDKKQNRGGINPARKDQRKLFISRSDLFFIMTG